MTEFLQLFFAADELGPGESDGLALDEGDEAPMEEVGLVARDDFDAAARDVTSGRCPSLELNEPFRSKLGDA